MIEQPSDVVAAVRDLRAIRSNDPCAAIAMTTIKATIHTLETRWMTADDRAAPDDG